MQPARFVCPFCGQRGARTDEHVIAKWVSREIVEILQGYADHFASRLKPGMRASTMNDVVPACSGCNSGWMNQTEIAVKPFLPDLLFGRSRVLMPGEVASLSRWAAKTGATAGMKYLKSDGQVNVGTAAMRQLVAGSIPEGWIIRIGRTSSPLAEMSWNVFDSETYGVEISNDESHEIECYVFSVSFRLVNLFVQVLGQPAGARRFRRSYPSRFPKLVEVWPSRPEVRWPLAQMSQDETMAAMQVLPPLGTPTDRGIVV